MLKTIQLELVLETKDPPELASAIAEDFSKEDNKDLFYQAIAGSGDKVNDSAKRIH